MEGRCRHRGCDGAGQEPLSAAGRGGATSSPSTCAEPDPASSARLEEDLDHTCRWWKPPDSGLRAKPRARAANFGCERARRGDLGKVLHIVCGKRHPADQAAANAQQFAMPWTSTSAVYSNCRVTCRIQGGCVDLLTVDRGVMARHAHQPTLVPCSAVYGWPRRKGSKPILRCIGPQSMGPPVHRQRQQQLVAQRQLYKSSGPTSRPTPRRDRLNGSGDPIPLSSRSTSPTRSCLRLRKALRHGITCASTPAR